MNPEAIEAAARASWAEANSDPWEEGDVEDKALFLADAKVMLEAALPYLIRESALKRMVSMPWFEDMVMAEAVAFHSGGNCRYVTEARAAELEDAAEVIDENQYDSRGRYYSDWLRDRATAIRDSA